jgi:hypothetical protein
MRTRLLSLLVVALAVLGACTPAQFQAWWVAQGNAPLAEPQLSETAAVATRYWEEVARRDRFRFTTTRIDAGLAARMTPSSYRAGCPVPLSSLVYVRVSHMGFDGREHLGELVVHRDTVGVVAAAFEIMWDDRFPIRSMRLVDDFGGSDQASMEADNTSAFNCRRVAGTTRWSQHAYGRAIDINPRENPWVSGSSFAPPSAAPYVVRTPVRPGMLTASSVAVRAFTDRGWGWGGTWRSSKDYQHVSASGN